MAHGRPAIHHHPLADDRCSVRRSSQHKKATTKTTKRHERNRGRLPTGRNPAVRFVSFVFFVVPSPPQEFRGKGRPGGPGRDNPRPIRVALIGQRPAGERAAEREIERTPLSLPADPGTGNAVWPARPRSHPAGPMTGVQSGPGRANPTRHGRPAVGFPGFRRSGLHSGQGRPFLGNSLDERQTRTQDNHGRLSGLPAVPSAEWRSRSSCPRAAHKGRLIGCRPATRGPPKARPVPTHLLIAKS
jgi:hypothetical protein